jgi:hypothetical protein
MPKTREQQRQYEADYRQRHRAAINARNRERYQANPPERKPISEERKAYLREYRRKNAERLAAKRQEYVQTNGKRLKQQQAEYRERSRQKINERMRGYSERVRPKKRVYMLQWYKANQARLAKKRAARYKADPAYRLRLNLRNRLNAAVRNGCKAGSAVRDLGCTIEEFIAYIAGLFLPGMSWENWGKWHLDHIKPLASFDLTDRDQFLAACHYTNMRPLWSADNLRKGARIV